MMARNYKLTPRQLEVMQLVVIGKSATTIGLFMGIAHNSVRHHQKEVIAKLECSGLLQAAALLTKRGIVDPEKIDI